VQALVRNAGREPLTYSWTSMSSLPGSHCTSQQYPATDRGSCVIRSPEQVVMVTVTVRDAHQREASDTLTLAGEGVNRPPTVRFFPPFTLPGGSLTLEMFGHIEDPDEGELCLASHVVSASATGDCQQQAALWSSCLEGGPTLDVYRTRPAGGTCEVTVRVRDSAGLVGTSVFPIRY
jgi:hypothetical protein